MLQSHFNLHKLGLPASLEDELRRSVSGGKQHPIGKDAEVSVEGVGSVSEDGLLAGEALLVTVMWDLPEKVHTMEVLAILASYGCHIVSVHYTPDVNTITAYRRLGGPR